VAISDPIAQVWADSTGNVSTYDSGTTASLSVDDVVLVFVVNVDGTTVDKATPSKIGGTATVGTFTEIGDITQTDTDEYRITAWWVKVTGAGTLQVRATFGDNQTGCNIGLVPLRGTDLTTPIREVTGTPQVDTNASTASKPSFTLPAAAAASSWTFAIASIRRNPQGYTNSEAGWSLDISGGLTTPANFYGFWHKESGDDTFAADGGTNGTWRGLMFEVQEPVAATDTEADVSWAEMEVPTAPRRADVAWAEAEVPTAPRRADISWSEMEAPAAPRHADVSWAEAETPDAPRRVDVAWAEAEVPTAPRSMDVSWSEMELPDAPRSADVGWAEMELPNAPRSLDVSWAEAELPDAPRSLDVSFAEMELPDPPEDSASVSWAEMEVPDAPRAADVGWAEMEVGDAPAPDPRNTDVSFAEMEIPTAPRAAQVSHAELVLQPGNGAEGWVVSEGSIGVPGSGVNRKLRRRPRGLGRIH
jgi:hypothetical protein